ncbi:MAG: SDR family oxidoreductase [Planctomycetota bacterium]
MNSQSKTIVISGGSRGLGLALVNGLLAHGHRVATFSRTLTVPLQDILQGPHGERLFYETLDASQPEAIVEFVKTVGDRFGAVDVLINNAAIARDGVFPMITDEDLHMMIDVNIRGALLLARECSRSMLDQSTGSIINISSIIAQRGFRGLAVYAATKAALIGFTKSLARELGARGIRVNAIAPGYLETDMSAELDEAQRAQIIRRTPLGRLGRAEDVLGTVEYLISPASEFMTGQVLVVDGGSSI